MYAMSWEIDNSLYKYETIQEPYTVEFYEYESSDKDLSLDELLEQEENELLESEREDF